MTHKHNGKWRPRKLNELGFVGRGKSRHRPRNAPELYGGPYPFFQTGDIKAADLYLRRYEQTYSELGLAQSKLWQPGTLCITIAANIAETAILSIPSCFPDSVVGFIPYEGESDSRFVKYYIDTIKLSMQNVSKGTTQDNLSLDKLLTFDFICPDLTTQRKIGGILSAYDDLIENNTRRIAILEEMAQSIYREWFVNFRFPEHENAKFIDSPLGKIPERWIATNLGEVVNNFDRLRKPLSSMQRADIQGKYPYYGAAKIFDHINNFIFDGKYLLVAEDGSVITPDRKPVLQMAYGKFWVNNHAHILQGKPPVCTEHICLSLSFTDVTGYVTGAAQPKINQANLNRMPFLVATNDVQMEFTELIVPLFDEMFLLNRKNRNLRTTRDLLLPKLICGQLDVEDIDIDTGVAQELMQ
jgi:type I restriction enzyme S subunit